MDEAAAHGARCCSEAGVLCGQKSTCSGNRKCSGGSRAQSRRSDQVQALHSHEGRVTLHYSTHPDVTRRQEALSSVVTGGTWLVRPVVV